MSLVSLLVYSQAVNGVAGSKANIYTTGTTTPVTVTSDSAGANVLTPPFVGGWNGQLNVWVARNQTIDIVWDNGHLVTIAIPAEAVVIPSTVSEEESRALAAESGLALIGGPFAPTGFVGATAPTRYVGGTASGAPVSGTFKTGDFVIDRTGAVWVCISGDGTTLGTWITTTSGVELAVASLSSDFTMSSASLADITGLSVTITAPSRPFKLELSIPAVTIGASAQYMQIAITDSANTLVQTGYLQAGPALGNVGAAPVKLETELPMTGTGAYAITPGNSYTFKARYSISATSGSPKIPTTSGTTRSFLRAVTL